MQITPSFPISIYPAIGRTRVNKAEVVEKVYYKNAQRVLGLKP